jgi:hypothetical protein
LFHNFTIGSSCRFEGTIHTKIFAHKQRHYFTISFYYEFSTDENALIFPSIASEDV